jgi:hypothetical protein
MTAVESPTGITAEELDLQVLAGARVYLKFGSARLTELVRVLAQHLETRRVEAVTASVMAWVAEGELHYNGSAMVSLPTGGGTREREEPQ